MSGFRKNTHTQNNYLQTPQNMQNEMNRCCCVTDNTRTKQDKSIVKN